MSSPGGETKDETLEMLDGDSSSESSEEESGEEECSDTGEEVKSAAKKKKKKSKRCLQLFQIFMISCFQKTNPPTSRCALDSCNTKLGLTAYSCRCDRSVFQDWLKGRPW